MIKTLDIYWIAGIIEGEGCLHLIDNKYPRIHVEMTDRDVIEKFCLITKSNLAVVNRGPTDQGTPRKIGYRAVIYGRNAASWIMIIYTLLGERRRAKAKEVLTAWKNNVRTYKTPSNKRMNNRMQYYVNMFNKAK